VEPLELVTPTRTRTPTSCAKEELSQARTRLGVTGLISPVPSYDFPPSPQTEFLASYRPSLASECSLKFAHSFSPAKFITVAVACQSNHNHDTTAALSMLQNPCTVLAHLSNVRQHPLNHSISSQIETIASSIWLQHALTTDHRRLTLYTPTDRSS
jgi:hypothetical protein